MGEVGANGSAKAVGVGGGCYFHFFTITLPFFEINGHFL